MDLQMFIIDAFAERPMSGNPAAVCPLEEWIPGTTMQAIAAEMNLAETAFFVAEGDAFAIRWFTPTREVDLIGHATLAAGHLVLSRLRTGSRSVRFISESGEISVTRETKRLSLNMPALVPEEILAPEGLDCILGSNARKVLAAKHYLVILDDPDDVATLAPDMTALAALDLPALIVTAPGNDGVDFVSRFFAPANGVPEDSVSGVAHCCLAPYWAQRLGRSKLVGRQLSRRGGIVYCEDRGDRVVLEGEAVIFLEGRIHI